MAKYNKRTLAKFIEIKDYSIKDWNHTMMVVAKIESIIEHAIDIVKETD